MMRYILMASLVFAVAHTFPASAQEAQAPAAEVKAEAATEKAAAQDSTYDERIKLSEKMHELRPVRAQVEQAINQYAQSRPAAERESFKTAMRNVFNIKALEKISIDAYANTFTLPELKAMVEYYSKPEAASASDKFADYAAVVYPEIVRMLDRAAIQVKTGQ